MSERPSAYWWQSMNFGDVLTPWMITEITGKRPVWVEWTHQLPYHVWSGSVLNWANGYGKVWGAGLGSMKDPVNPESDLVAVRGPLSAMIAKQCGNKSKPAAMGDVGLCLRKLIKPSQEKDDKIALVPHYVDYFRVREVYGDKKEFRIVDLLSPVEKVVEEITRSECVVSSALHGLVVADAYNMHAAWAKFSTNICGDGTKYVDHMAAVGRIEVGDWAYPIDVHGNNEPENAEWWRVQARRSRHIDTLIDKLWDACPLRR